MLLQAGPHNRLIVQPIFIQTVRKIRTQTYGSLIPAAMDIIASG